MSYGWENIEPAPLEFMHNLMHELFHEFRTSKTENINVEINGSDFHKIIAKAKTATYEKYKHLNLKRNIPKDEFINQPSGKEEGK